MGLEPEFLDYSDVIPKPMVKVGDKPILWRIMKIFANYGHNDFLLALGYKSEFIKDYFINYETLNSDLTVNLSSGDIKILDSRKLNWNITMVDTGLNTMTGGRVKRMKKYIGNERFFLTYGDGLSDINLNELLEFHKNHGKMVTVTAVHPAARFGELLIEKGEVKSFKEKPQTQKGWINGGFFVLEPEFLDLILDDNTILEKDPLEKACKLGQLMAYQYEGFWQCMDTKRDKDLLEEFYIQSLTLSDI